MTLGRVLLVVVSCLALQIAGRAAASGSADVVTASGLQINTLPNGLRYAVLPHVVDEGRVSLRLIVHAGSLDERDDERGYAHFVEHMAFNGTRNYPPGKLVLFFQRNGIHWGADANATTGFIYTTYRIDLPAGHADQVEEALRIFRDYADGIEFARAEVRREKGVITSELTARNTNSWQVDHRRLAAHYQGSAIAERLPAGTEAGINDATAARLRAFYRRCYRPERMILLVVGDVTAEHTAALVEKHFASLAGTGPGAAPVLPEVPAGDGLRAAVIANPSATAASVTLTAVRPAPADAQEHRLQSHAAYVVLRALDRRLRERQREHRALMGFAGAQRSAPIDGRFWETGFEAQAAIKAWPLAVNVIENELRRARESGFSPAEIKELIDALRASARAERDAAPRLSPVQLAGEIARVLERRGEWVPAAQVLAEIEAWAEHFDPEAAAQTLNGMFPEERTHLLLTLREPGNIQPAELLSSYHESAAQPLAEILKPSDEELAFRYDDFGPAGAVANHRTVPDLGIELVEFINGARLNVRSSDTQPNQFLLNAFLGRGLADSPRDRPGMQLLAVNLLGSTDLNRNTREELGRLIRTRALSVSVNFEQNNFFLRIEGPSTELPFALRFLTAFLSDLKFDEASFNQALSSYGAGWGRYVSSSQAMSGGDLEYRLRSDDPRLQFPPRSVVERYPLADVVAWLKTHWLEGPIEIALAGDVDVHDAIAQTALTLGALPARGEATALRDEERSVLPAKLYRNLSPTEMADAAATVQFAWVAKDLADARVLRALAIANDALLDRLRVRLREQKGATYSPRARISRDPVQLDFGYANIEITFDPAQAQKLAEQVLKLADEFAQKGLTQEEFSRVREVAMTQTAESIRDNAWWLNHVLARAQSQPSLLDEARTFASDFAGLTREEVNRVAASHFRLRHAHVVGILPKRPQAAVPTSPPPKGDAPSDGAPQ